MNGSKLEQRRDIVNKFLDSGINVSPSALDLILTLEKPLEKANIIIKETSFMPSFDYQLTESVLNKISFDEMQRVLKRSESKSETNRLASESKDIFKDSKIKEPNTSTKSEVVVECSSTQSPSILSSPIPQNTPFNKVLMEDKQEESKASSLGGVSISEFAFKPVAKDYEAQYEILSDPTGKLFTSGEYSDFYELTMDKFNKLQTLMKKRTGGSGSNRIANILRLSNKVEITASGLVSDIYLTKKGNYFITLEDNSGTLNIVVRKDIDSQENFKKKDNDNQDNLNNFKVAERVLCDQMLYVEGMYNPGEKGKKGIVYATGISKIDVQSDFKPNLSQEPLSIALLSDTHIGSREFEEDLWNRFTNFLNGKIGNKSVREAASRIKYIIINGDLVDGIGVYPNQENFLLISDIYNQFKKAAELLSKIPDHIKIFYSTGNHDPVRNALPRPAVPEKYTNELRNIGVKCVGNPSIIQTHGVNTLAYHGDSLLDMTMLIPGLENSKPVEIMKELLICRHLAPVFGKKTQIAPTAKDFLTIEKIPDIFHTGHLHINGMGKYRNVSLVNSGCFQSQTDFMKSFGITPTPGFVPVIELNTLNGFPVDLNSLN